MKHEHQPTLLAETFSRTGSQKAGFNKETSQKLPTNRAAWRAIQSVKNAGGFICRQHFERVGGSEVQQTLSPLKC